MSGIDILICILIGSVAGFVVPIGILRFLWWREDRAFTRMSGAWFDAALKGVDTSFMNDCPDLHEHAKRSF